MLIEHLERIHTLTPLQREVVKLQCDNVTSNVTTLGYMIRQAAEMSEVECRQHIAALSD